jgi:hypothetical protein
MTYIAPVAIVKHMEKTPVDRGDELFLKTCQRQPIPYEERAEMSHSIAFPYANSTVLVFRAGNPDG